MIIPLALPYSGTFSDEELVKFCAHNPNIGIERDEHGRISIDMLPSYILTSSNNSELNTEIGLWNRKTKAGKVIDSNGGFLLKDRSMRAPDVAWIRHERWDTLSEGEKKSIPHLVPDFVIELLSDTDSLKKTQKKWKNGSKMAFGWRGLLTRVISKPKFTDLVSQQKPNRFRPHYWVEPCSKALKPYWPIF